MRSEEESTIPVLLDETELRFLLSTLTDHEEEYGHYGLSNIEFEILMTKIQASLEKLLPGIVIVAGRESTS